VNKLRTSALGAESLSISGSVEVEGEPLLLAAVLLMDKHRRSWICNFHYVGGSEYSFCLKYFRIRSKHILVIVSATVHKLTTFPTAVEVLQA
jgi:hypothetical protein